MNRIWILSKNTILELYRDKLLYVLIFLGCILLLLSVLFSNLSIQEGLRLTIDFGLSCVHIIIQAISIFIGSHLVQKEIEKKTILLIMSYPVERFQFILGKILGFSIVQLVVITLMGFLFSIVLFLFSWSFHFSYIQALIGIYLESLILLSLMVSFGGVLRPVTSILMGLGVFLAGHSLNNFRELSFKNKNELSMVLSQFFDFFIPNLENLNFRASVVYFETQGMGDIVYVTVYSVIWIVLYTVLGILLFRRRDFV